MEIKATEFWRNFNSSTELERLTITFVIEDMLGGLQ